MRLSIEFIKQSVSFKALFVNNIVVLKPSPQVLGLPGRYGDTYFTETQVKVLEMYFSGMKVDEIAKKLGKSRADIYLILRRAKNVVKRCSKTLEVYASVKGFIDVELEAGKDVLSAIDAVLRAADAHNIKLSETSAQLLMSLLKTAEACGSIEGLSLKRPIKARIRKEGKVLFMCVT